jgi:hypothetical protein
MAISRFFLSSEADNSCSVKDLPQEVKDGLEIIHVRYVSHE